MINQYSKVSERGKVPRTRRTIPKFLEKLYQLLENKLFMEIISWSENGKCVVIKNEEKFTVYILPKLFKQNSFNSFLRQMNAYQFEKSRSLSNEIYFHNTLFCHGYEHLLLYMKRNGQKKKETENNIEQNNPKPNKKPLEEIELEAKKMMNSTMQMNEDELNDLLLEQINQITLAQEKLSRQYRLCEIQHEAFDLSTQLDFTDIQRREVDSKFAYFLMFVMNKYVESQEIGGIQMEKLEIGDRNCINNTARLFTRNHTDTGPLVCQRFYRAMEISHFPPCEHNYEDFKKIAIQNISFLDWVNEFIRTNEINFPYLEKCIAKLIYCVVRSRMYEIQPSASENPFQREMNKLCLMAREIHKNGRSSYDKTTYKERLMRKGFTCEKIGEELRMEKNNLAQNNPSNSTISEASSEDIYSKLFPYYTMDASTASQKEKSSSLRSDSGDDMSMSNSSSKTDSQTASLFQSLSGMATLINPPQNNGSTPTIYSPITPQTTIFQTPLIDETIKDEEQSDLSFGGDQFSNTGEMGMDEIEKLFA